MKYVTGATESMQSHSTGIRNLKFDEYKGITVPIPSLEVQKRIVQFIQHALSAIDKARTNAEKNLQNAKEVLEKLLQNEFAILSINWPNKKISELAETGSGGTPLKAHKDYYENGSIPWLRSGEVCRKEITECEMYITTKGLNNSSAKLFPTDTVLVAMYGATAAQVGILKFESSTNQAVCGILPSKLVLPEFLYYTLLSKRDELVAQAVGGAQPNISQIKIKETMIPLPPLSKQSDVCSKLNCVFDFSHQLQSIYLQKIAALDELKKSILEKAFKGELTEKTKHLHLADL